MRLCQHCHQRNSCYLSGKNRDVIVQLVNNGSDPSLVQAWIDDGDINSTPETANVPFLLSPPVVKVSGNNGQQLRIQKVGAALPADRESVFYLNVLDIPPTPENLQGVNTLQLAIKSRIKLFYRPASLKGGVNAITDAIVLQVENKGFRVVNKSPYFSPWRMWIRERKSICWSIPSWLRLSPAPSPPVKPRSVRTRHTH